MARKTTAARKVTAAAPRQTRDSRERVVNAAERLFAERGYHAVSLRTIMSAARVSVSAAHYHFGSKKILLQAVLDRRAPQINQSRKERLLACVGKDGNISSLEDVLEAFVSPSLEICADPGGQLFVRMSALIAADPSPEVQDVLQTAYDESAMLFVKLLKRACPNLKTEDLYWRLICIYGTMLYIRINNQRISRILRTRHLALNPTTVKEALHHLIPVLAAVLSLPPIKKRVR